MGFELTSTWQTKPSVGTQINWCHPLSNGLIGCWLMNENCGYKVTNLASPIGIGTLINGATWGVGNLGEFVNFNSTTGYISLGNNIALKPYLPVTMALWIYLPPNYNPATQYAWFNNDALFSDNTYSGVDILDDGTGKVELDFGNGGGSGPTSRRSKVGTTILSTQKWYFLVGVIRGATDMSIYVNGLEDGGSYSGTGGALVYSGARDAEIGATGGINLFNGNISYVLFYNRSLISSEVKSLYYSPYQFFNYPTQFAFNSISTTTTNFRKTLSGIGTRTGNRQTIGV